MDIVLTGASGGIGSAIYRVLYKEGINKYGEELENKNGD